MTTSAIDRTRPPAPGTLRPFRFPPFETHRLPNGLQLKVMASDRVPLVTLEMLYPGGGQHNPADRPGLASLVGDLLDEGTSRGSSLDLARRIEGLGGSLDSGSGWNMGYADVGVLSSHFGEGLELLAEVTREASFPEAEIDRLRDVRNTDLLRRQAQPAILARDAFLRAVYGTSAYGFPELGTVESLAAIDRGDITGFAQRHVVPEGSTLVAVGDIDPDEVLQQAERLFGTWQGEPVEPPTPIRPRAIEGLEIHLVDRPGSSQTQLEVGCAGPPRHHPDFHALMVATVLFGGKFTSRINLNLRERHGFTYGASAQLVRRRGPGPFGVRTAVATEFTGRALGEIVSELDRLRTDLVTLEELQDTHDYLLGVFPFTVQSIDQLASRLQALAVFNLPDDHFDHFPAVLAEVDREMLRSAVERHIQTDALAIVAVGPADVLEPQLAPHGPVTIHRR